jgi:phage baseplate assembly protein W
MAQPITQLSATWTSNQGIILSWTAATDATSGSVYNIYVLEEVESVTPLWVPVAQCLPVLVKTGASQPVVLAAPTTTYTLPQSVIAALQQPGSTIAPDSFAFSVIHVDYTDTASVATNISVFQHAMNQAYGAAHLTNNFGLDAYGQWPVNPQDSYDEIAASVSVFMGTALGQRPVVPDYGVPDFTFDTVDLNAVTTSLNQWEPRAGASISVSINDQNQETMIVQIQGTAS